MYVFLLFFAISSFWVYASPLIWDTISNWSTIDDWSWTWKIWIIWFNDGSGSVAWSNNNDAVFWNWGIGWIVTISWTVSPNSVAFNAISWNYTITGGILTITNTDTQWNISTWVSPTIYSTISGTGWIFKLWAGTLTLGGTNTYTNDTIISEWKVIITNNNALGSTGSIYISSWAILDISSLNFFWQDAIKSRTTIANGWNLITTIQSIFYDFETDTAWSSPTEMTIEYKWLLNIWSIVGVHGKWATAYTSSGAWPPIVPALLTKFPTATDYSIIWLQSSTNTWYKNGFTLRAQPTRSSSANSWVRPWYLFQVANYMDQLQFAVVSTTWYTISVKNISWSLANTSRRYKATVIGNTQTFSYSDISSKGPWIVAIQKTYTTYIWWGYTQYTDGWNYKSLNTAFVDDITMQYDTLTTIVPDKLSNPILVSISDTSATFNLTWLGQIDEYEITANPWAIVVTGTTSTITINWLSPNTTYGFTAIAKNTAGSSQVSDTYTGTTLSSSTSITYSTTWATSGDVVAQLTGLSGATITNNGWSNIYTFTWNGSFTFTFTQWASTWSATATVANIDKIAPTGTISYSTTWTTSGNVVATLTWVSESITITNNGWSNAYIFTGNGNFTFNFIDQVGNTWSSMAVVNWINSPTNTGIAIALTSPVDYQVIQRNTITNTGNMLIVGTYTGNLSWIEASWNGGVFTNIAATITGGVFSGTLSNQTAGQGTLIVRVSNNTGITTSISTIGIWDIFIVAGQSNAAWWWANPQIFTWTNGIKAIVFGNDYLWKILRDPYDDDTNQIDTVSLDAGANWSFVPLLATKIVASQNIPVAFVPTAMWWTQVTAWAPWANHFDRNTLYGSMAYRIREVGGNVAGVLRFQWESDVMMKRTTSAYIAGLNTIINTLQSDFSDSQSIKFFIWSIWPNNYSGYAIDAIRKAQQEIHLSNPYVYTNNALTYDINIADEGGWNLHFRSNGELEAFSERWWNSIAKDYYGIAVNTPPKILSTGIVFFTKTNTLALSFDMPLATQVPSSYTNNLSWITYLTGSTEAFGISWSHMIVQSVSLSWSNTLVLQLSWSFTWWEMYVNYANGLSWVNKAIYSTISYQPAYPIYAQSISIVENTAPIVILEGSWSITLHQWDSYQEEWAHRTDNIDWSWMMFTWTWWQVWSFTISWNINTHITWTYYIQYNKVDLAWNSHIISRTITILNSIPILWIISYSNTWATSGNVIATLSLNTTGTITNNWWNNTYIFTDNWAFTFNFTDWIGNTWSTTATVNEIDKIKPNASIYYSSTWATNWNIIVKLTWYSETIIIANNWWSDTHIFTGNWLFTFNFVDEVGNTWSETATVYWIEEIMVVDSQDNWWDNTINGTWKILLTWWTSTWVTFNWSWIISIKELDGSWSLEINTSWCSIIASWDRDMSLLAPTKIWDKDNGYAEFWEPGIPSRTTSDKTRDILTTIEAWSTWAEIKVIWWENFKITILIDSWKIWQELKIYRSHDGYNWIENEPDTICILDWNKRCSFYTNHLSYFTAIWETTSTNSWWGGGWWQTRSTKDICPNGDYSISYYDKICWEIAKEDNELRQAYDFAYMYWITTKKTLTEANVTWVVIRIDLAKMIVNYAMNILWKTINEWNQCTFDDLWIVSEEMKVYAIKACQLWLMWIDTDNKFNPNSEITRAEFATTISRALRWEKYNATSPTRYTQHLNALKKEWIIKNIENPMTKELRWYVMLMLMRTK